MTPEQMALYIKVLQFGFGTGCTTRRECVQTYLRAYPAQREAVICAAAEFERGCCYCPEQELYKAGLSDAELVQVD